MSKVNLTKEDWVEIYAALESKLASRICDQQWANQLERIKKKIGPDGRRAFGRGVASKHDDWWTVVLAVPGGLAEKSGRDYYCNSAVGSAVLAADIVRSKAVQSFQDPRYSPRDFSVIDVFKGRHVSRYHDWRRKEKKRNSDL